MSCAGAHVVLVSLDRGIRWSSKKGASVHLHSMARGLREAGARVDLVMPEGIAVETSSEEPPSFSSIPGLESIRRFHDRDGREGAELEALAGRAHVLDTLLALHERDPIDVVYERYSLFSDVGARLSERTGVPLALETNAPLIEEQSRYRELVMRRAAELIESRQLHGATRVFPVSRALAEWVKSRGVSPERIRVLPNTAERSEMFRRPYDAPVSGSPFVVGFSGSLKPWHGIRWFLDVFADVAVGRPHLRLEILGHGPLRGELEERARQLDVTDQVRFLGHVAHQDVPEAIAGWHLVVAPYPPLDDFYFSPLKVVEALAAGRPVMASAVGDIPELLDGGRCGRLVAAGDTDRWRDALVEMLDQPTSLTSLAEEAERRTRDWSWTGHAEVVLQEVAGTRIG